MLPDFKLFKGAVLLVNLTSRLCYVLLAKLQTHGWPLWLLWLLCLLWHGPSCLLI